MRLRFKGSTDEGKRIDLSDLPSPEPELPHRPVVKTWKPIDGSTKTMEYGKGTPTPTPTAPEMAERDVAEYYPYLLKGSEEYERRLKEYLL